MNDEVGLIGFCIGQIFSEINSVLVLVLGSVMLIASSCTAGSTPSSESPCKYEISSGNYILSKLIILNVLGK